MSEAVAEPFLLYAGLSTPAIITDAEHRLVYLNPRAEALWDVSLQAVVGRCAAEALRIEPPDGVAPGEWSGGVVPTALTTGDPFPCRTTTPDGRARILHLIGTRFHHDGQWYIALTVPSQMLSDGPWAGEGAIHDPLTGLHNLHHWQRESTPQDAQPGAVAFFDLDGLARINDRGGRRAGDRALIIAAEALARHVPPAGLCVRFGADEFVWALPGCGREAAVELAESAVAAAEDVARGERLPLPVRLSYGIAAFEAGGLAEAVDDAREALADQRARRRGQDTPNRPDTDPGPPSGRGAARPPDPAPVADAGDGPSSGKRAGVRPKGQM